MLDTLNKMELLRACVFHSKKKTTFYYLSPLYLHEVCQQIKDNKVDLDYLKYVSKDNVITIKLR